MKTTRLVFMGALLTSMLPLMALPARKKAPVKEPAQKYYTEIKSMNEYETACEASVPTVIVYSSSSCTACDVMEPGLNECAKTYRKAKFYMINGEDEKFKEIHKKVKIEAYPTTHFLKNGQDPRIERGSMGAEELDNISYEFVNGKRKPFVKKSAKPVEIKKSLQEKTK